MAQHGGTVFTAVSSSARQLFLLLRCISFAPKAEVQITHEGLRFSVEEARVIQGLAFLEKNLFTSYSFYPPSLSEQAGTADSSRSESSITPTFQVSLAALLETLQIFGISDSTTSGYGGRPSSYSSSLNSAFSTPALALGGTCRITYAGLGAPLSITLDEGNVTTTCDLTTYEPHHAPLDDDDFDEAIPLQRDALSLKIIMRSTWLHNAITELSSTNPEVLSLTASATSAPYLSLSGLGGPYGDSSVDFQPKASSKDDAVNGSKRKSPIITETFQVAPPAGTGSHVRQRYRFELIKKAGRAMALASKVSIRGDAQGVLSLQFMIEVGDGATMGRSSSASREENASALGGTVVGGNTVNGQKVSFVDFRFVPLLDEDDDSGSEDYEEDGDTDGEDDSHLG
ncbi:MAG: hypothetical protein Q9160_006840 [Pyrenula sp. 1 TL-2023]